MGFSKQSLVISPIYGPKWSFVMEIGLCPVSSASDHHWSAESSRVSANFSFLFYIQNSSLHVSLIWLVCFRQQRRWIAFHARLWWLSHRRDICLIRNQFFCMHCFVMSCLKDSLIFTYSVFKFLIAPISFPFKPFVKNRLCSSANSPAVIFLWRLALGQENILGLFNKDQGLSGFMKSGKYNLCGYKQK